MKKKRQRLLAAVFILAAAGIRILYFFLENRGIADTYGYYAHAMIELGRKEPMLTSGLAYAYTESLSDLLGFMGNHIEPIAVYQMLLQIIWLLMFFFGMRYLCGNTGSFVSGIILVASPWLLQTIFVVSPENYFMLAFSVLLLALGFFYKRTKICGWYRSNGCEIYLMLLGFLTGMVCTWNYLGWVLVPWMGYVLFHNYRNLEERIWEQKQKKELEEKYQIMPVLSQTLILSVGILMGMFATLMKYTGLTGLPVVEQFIWWLEQYRAFPGRCQDVSVEFMLWLLPAIAAGIACAQVEKLVMKRRLLREMYVDEERNEETAEKATDAGRDKEKMEENSIITADGRKVKLLDNPLPVPKRHVKREMDFKIKEAKEQTDASTFHDDFDYQINENDDFDV